jgi:hypothetical protein
VSAWSAPTAIPSAETISTPALADYDGLLYAAWTGNSSTRHIWYSAFNGTSWTAQTTVPSALTNITGPALGVYGGDLYVVWEGQSKPYQLWFSAFNGSTWTAQAKVPSAFTQQYFSPGLAAYDGSLYLTWIGQGASEKVWYSAYNGSSWSPQTTIPGATSVRYQGSEASLTVYDGNLFASWQTSTTPEVAYASFNGTSWTGPMAITSVSAAGPGLAVKGAKLFDAWTNDESAELGDITYSTYNGSTWTAAKLIPGAVIGYEVGPALATYSGKLYVAWDPNSTSTIDYVSGP